jgi:hypothetical protein
VIAAAPPLAELAAKVADKHARRGRDQPVVRGDELVGRLVVACGDLADGFAAPPDSARRRQAHHRAWTAVRDIDRAIAAAGRQRLAPAGVLRRAQRAIDRADVMIGALLPA